MNRPGHDNQRMAELLGYHLGLTDESEKRRVESAFNAAELDDARRKVQGFLTPLDRYEAPRMPSRLVQGVMDRIDAERAIIKFPQRPAAQLATEAAAGPGSGPLLPLRELVGLAAAIMLFVGILVPGYRSARTAAQRAICADHLRIIGNGYAGYAEANQAYLPFRAAAPAGASWAPGGGGTPTFSNSQHAFLLVKNSFVQPGVFICPGRPNDFGLDAKNPADLDDFPNAANNSYTTNLVTQAWRQQTFEPDMPLASDMSPLVDEHRELIREGQPPENSQSHGQSAGQNVLRNNISVIWSPTPRVGVDSDDIYRVIGVQEYTGQERPQLRSDAFLVP